MSIISEIKKINCINDQKRQEKIGDFVYCKVFMHMLISKYTSCEARDMVQDRKQEDWKGHCSNKIGGTICYEM